MLLPLAAHADLYRWIDPATGSIKYSSQPPSDPGIEADVVRYNAPPPPKPAPAKPAPVVVPPSNTAELEARWRSLAAQLIAIPPQELKAGSERVRQQIQALEAARAELDRLDPGGTARRSAEMVAMMQRAPKAQ
ncbi:MAG TPA: DUF4124 domain-containing protein [Burkholderiales bacterium]|nr:DUF4124 domain-containing protein [Burkholderiales bacterium]